MNPTQYSRIMREQSGLVFWIGDLFRSPAESRQLARPGSHYRKTACIRSAKPGLASFWWPLGTG
jgi:hypothetical protein